MSRSPYLWAVLIVAVMSVGTSANVFNNCTDKIMNLQRDVAEQLVLASSTSLGFLGRFQDCIANETMSNWCLVTFNLTSVLPSVVCAPNVYLCNIGVCLPPECTADLIAEDWSYIAGFLGNRTHVKLPELLQEVHCYQDNTVDVGAAVAISVCCLAVFLVLVGSMVGFIVNPPKSGLGALIPCIRMTSPAERLPSGYTSINDDDGPTNAKPLKRRPGKLAQLLMCWSLQSNVERLLAPVPGDEKFEALNGLRALSMFWVLLGHSGIYQLKMGWDNPIFLQMEEARRFSFQFVMSAQYSVDSFFFLSGFLVSYFLLQQLYKKGIRKPSMWIMFYIHRFLRLVPLYAFVMMCYIWISPIAGNGPFWFVYKEVVHKQAPQCWINFLFVNNFWPTDRDSQCMDWTWYLANDTQFYMISPIFVVLFYLKPIAGYAAAAAGIISSITTIIVIASVDNLSAYVQEQAVDNYFNLYYDKPYTRISPYLVGMITAFYYTQLFRRAKLMASMPDNPLIQPVAPRKEQRSHMHITLPPWLVWLGYPLISACLIGAVFGTYKSWNNSHITNVVYVAFSSFAFSLGVAFLMLTAFCGYGGLVTRFLELRIWEPLGKVTYGTYLLHPIMMWVIYLSHTQYFHYSVIYSVLYYLSLSIMAYGLGVMLFLIVERPIVNLERLLLHSR